MAGASVHGKVDARKRWWGKHRAHRHPASSPKVDGDNHQQALTTARNRAAMRVSCPYASLDLERVPPD